MTPRIEDIDRAIKRSLVCHFTDPGFISPEDRRAANVPPAI
ncbi:MAG TPA: hypothetical protein VFO40_28170 [Chthoniobacterales bacterium]|nr:hypothetical protein [Chthoniobacterales bacterium]